MKTVVIDPEMSVRNKIERILQKAGDDFCLCGSAGDGREGFELIRREQPELVIMDIELPKMKGLSLIKRLRRETCSARVIILTADHKFEDICQALNLGVSAYLPKPLRPARLTEILERVKEEADREKTAGALFNAESILRECVSGMLRPDETFLRMMQRSFGFTVQDPGDGAAIWLGKNYEAQKESVREILNGAGITAENGGYVFFVDVWQVIMVILCGDKAEQMRRDGVGSDRGFEEKILPVLCTAVQGELVCIWFEMERLLDLTVVMKKMREIGAWNLLFDRGELIRVREVENLKTVPLKYPAKIEEQARKAVLASEGEQIKKCYYRLYDVLRQEIHDPAEMKECLLRFNMALVNVYKTHHIIGSELEIQKCMQEILTAVTWRQIRDAMERFMNTLNFDAFLEEGDEELSPLVRKALQIVRKYYDQGITLEEIADTLFVSGEYLSSQFKKETGAGFSETVKRYRINRIKELLLGTRLKINQIAELTGYADPKYMSKVFREETGVLPSEFRKSVH